MPTCKKVVFFCSPWPDTRLYYETADTGLLHSILHFLSPNWQSWIHCLVICAIQLLTANNLGGTWRHICSPDIRSISALEMLRNRALQIDIYLLTELHGVPVSILHYSQHGCRTLQHVGQYEIILVGDRGTEVWITWPKLLCSGLRLGVELTTSWSLYVMLNNVHSLCCAGPQSGLTECWGSVAEGSGTDGSEEDRRSLLTFPRSSASGAVSLRSVQQYAILPSFICSEWMLCSLSFREDIWCVGSRIVTFYLQFGSFFKRAINIEVR